MIYYVPILHQEDKHVYYKDILINFLKVIIFIFLFENINCCLSPPKHKFIDPGFSHSSGVSYIIAQHPEEDTQNMLLF